MRIVIAAVGRPRDPDYRELIDGYLARARALARVDEVKIAEGPDGAVDAAVARMLDAVGKGAELVPLDATGESFTSEGFARRVGEIGGRDAVPCFLVGGPRGVPDAVRVRATWTLALGPMTLPHRIARLVLAEQVYRALTVLHGEPYAH